MSPEDNQERRAALVMLLRAHGVRDTRVLNAFERVPRRMFVPQALVDRANRDSPLPLPCGQTMERPSVAAKMLEALQVEPDQRVLEVGAGSGWLTAVLSGLAVGVIGIERYRTLAEEAQKRLERLNLKAEIRHGDALQAIESGPFDRILVSAAVEKIPEALTSRLMPNGVILAPVGPGKMRQQLIRFTKMADGLKKEILWPIRAAPLEQGSPRYL